MNKNFWGFLLVIWFITLGLVAPYIVDYFGGGFIVKAIFVVVALAGIIFILSKHDDAESKQSDLYNRINKLEKTIEFHEDRIDRLREDVDRLEKN